MELYLMLSACIAAAGWSSYKIGLRQGAEKMLEHLQEGSIIDIDDAGKITPKFPL
jgi:hypothetical protein|tara:strand:- start:382 stop:546 length:165 start_codon:yes stop_codon:yes gene_type:complete